MSGSKTTVPAAGASGRRAGGCCCAVGAGKSSRVRSNAPGCRNEHGRGFGVPWARLVVEKAQGLVGAQPMKGESPALAFSCAKHGMSGLATSRDLAHCPFCAGEQIAETTAERAVAWWNEHGRADTRRLAQQLRALAQEVENCSDAELLRAAVDLFDAGTEVHMIGDKLRSVTGMGR